jgi:proteasome accessory factor B
MKPPRINRIFEILAALQGGRGHNIDSLAQLCGISRRTVFRDLESLREAGLPLSYSEIDGAYRLEGGPRLSVSGFTPDEALAFLSVCHELTGDNLPFFQAARSAALKLERTLAADVRRRLRRVLGAIKVQLEPQSALAGQQFVFQQLVQAVSHGQCVRIRYDDFSAGQVIVTRLSPFRLLFSRRSWYAIGQSSIHREVRTFNLARVLELTPLEDRYQVPQRFSVKRFLRNAWHMIPERGADREVRVRFRPLVARNVAEVAWHRTQRLSWNADGSLDYCVKVSGLKEISWWILGYGDQALVLEPPDLRALVGQRAAAMAGQYTGD